MNHMNLNNSEFVFDTLISELTDLEKEDIKNYILNKKYKQNNKLDILSFLKKELDNDFNGSSKYKASPILYDPNDFNMHIKIYDVDEKLTIPKYIIKIYDYNGK